MNPPRHDAPRYAVGGDSLIIGLDFGTTFSGVAYAYSTDPENIWTISDWPGGEDRLVPKAPSVLKYEDGSTTSFQWGYQLDLTRDANITELKLLLDPDQPRPYFISSNVQAEMARLPKGVMDVASDYMRVMLQHAVKQIEKEVMDRSILDNYQKKFVLTVPAVWSDKAKDLTLRNGDIIVICDAGGGTVDLVSYEIQSLDPFELKALTAPSGGLCGSLMLNKRFEDEVLQAVGDEAYVKLKKTDAYRSALKEFDTVVKIAFRGKNDPDRFVSFPMADLKDNTAAGLVKNAMALSGSTMFRIFDPIIREIDKLVSDQVTRVRLERLQLGDTTKASVKVGESRGAVMSKLGLSPTVIATKAPKHYGTCCTAKWEANRDRGYQKFKDVWEEEDKCSIMQWFIYKDDDLVRGKKLKLPFYRKWPGTHPNGSELHVEEQLYESSVLLAPDHPEDEVKLNCTLKSDLSKVPKSCFVKKKRASDGAKYIEIHYSLQVENNESGLMKFSIEVDGKEYAAVDATY
ncbi:hypothetical protein MANI_111979 [Metarhizium anisopliae]|nr:hypothetical protein MANI_111979 [Metarhizium anisopliae]